LIALLQRTQPKKWQQVLRSSQAQGLRPPAPIPPEWYDHDYFETGRKSNWKNGYKWETFSGLFVETAKFITAVFPEANSFLDIGCAKGFLVRCLREAGKDCWGIDFSSWAINHAESMSASFLRLSDVNDFPFDRKFDVLLALSILETLTEPQIRDLLTRARKGTKTAIFAVIPSYESPGEEEHLKLEDQDLSHVTIRSRTWWHEEFLRAGWRQGAAGGAWQRTSQTNPLCVRMGWKVYVYEAR